MPPAIRVVLALFVALASAAWLGYGYLAIKDARVAEHVTAQASDRVAVGAATSSSAPSSARNRSARVDSAPVPIAGAATPRETGVAWPGTTERAPIATLVPTDAADDAMRPPGDYRIGPNGVAEQLRSTPDATGSNSAASVPERPPAAVSSQ